MKTKAKVLTILTVLLFTNSCTNTETKNVTPTAEKQWLQNSPCAFPCWQGITPQETDFDDVMMVFGQAKMPIDFTAKREGTIDFQFQNTIAGSIHRASNGLVDLIVLNVQYQETTLDDLEQLVGQPDKISVGKSLNGGTCHVLIVFEEKGILLDLLPRVNQPSSFDKATDCKVDINSDSQIFRIVLFGSINHSEFWKKAYSKLDYMEWKGYGKYL
jgi:hypothetical protein